MFYMVSWQADRAAVYKLKALIKHGGILLWESYASGIFQSKILRKYLDLITEIQAPILKSSLDVC